MLLKGRELNACIYSASWELNSLNLKRAEWKHAYIHEYTHECTHEYTHCQKCFVLFAISIDMATLNALMNNECVQSLCEYASSCLKPNSLAVQRNTASLTQMNQIFLQWMHSHSSHKSTAIPLWPLRNECIWIAACAHCELAHETDVAPSNLDSGRESAAGRLVWMFTFCIWMWRPPSPGQHIHQLLPTNHCESRLPVGRVLCGQIWLNFS